MSNIKDAPISGEALAALFAALPVKAATSGLMPSAEVLAFKRKDRSHADD